MRETTASAAVANWRDAHLQMLKGIGRGVNRDPKTKHIMTTIMLNMNVKSLIEVVSFRYSLRFHIESLMRSARMFVCFLELYHAPKLFINFSFFHSLPIPSCFFIYFFPTLYDDFDSL